MTAPSPVPARVTVLETDPQAVAEVTVDADAPVFAGHYPGFPIFPGTCLVECVLRSATLTASEPVSLVAVDSVRLSRVLVPGDVLTIALSWTAEDEILRCAATVSVRGVRAATVRLTLARSGERS